MEFKKGKQVKFWVFCIMLVFLLSSSTQAVIKIDQQTISVENNKENITMFGDQNFYTWEDSFENGQKIDESYSENYILKNGHVEMYGTFPQWTDPEWTRMKKITINSDEALEDCVIKLIVEYDSDMRSDYGDLRFKFDNENFWLNYWIEEKNPEPNNPYAIVWTKIEVLPSGNSQVYMFYGNPDATDQSDYWSVFDKDSWQKEHVHDHRVTTHWYKEGAWDPDVAYNSDGDEFLVTWEEGTGYWPMQGTLFQQQIRARYYDTDGQPTSDRFDIVDEPDETPPYRYENPSNAYGKNGRFLVAYERYTNPLTNQNKDRDIEGAMVSTPTDGAANRFTICDASDIQADPCVAYDPNNQRFLVVWEDARSGTTNYDIYGRFYDTNGNPIGSDFPVCNDPNPQCEPWVSFDSVNNHYMVVWETSTDEPDTGPFEIWGGLYTWQGNELKSLRLSDVGSSNTDYNFPCVAFCTLTERYLVTWQEDDISSDDWHGNIWGKILDENANTMKDNFKIERGEFERTNIIPHLSSSFFVVYDGGGEIWGKLVSSEGNVNPYTLQLSDGESDPADWANIASSGEKIFVSWEDTRVVYQSPFDDMPDVYSNVWSFNTPSSSDVSVSFGEEKSLILNAHITSVPINPVNWDSWHQFDADKSGDVTFDIVDSEDPNVVIMEDISPGASIQSISQGSIRLRASFSRDNPSSSPLLNSWSLTYVGIDEIPPRSSIENIEGIKGLNEWYISESVILWLHAEDYPEDTGSGVKKVYYTLNNGQTQEYISESGIQLSVSQSSKWWGTWDVCFWAEDNSGNEEEPDDDNYITIKIDADRPFVNITEPANEEEVETPFWVRADPSDNVGIDRVEFDIEPFGEREGLPYVDNEPPFEWYCDVEQKDDSKSKHIPRHLSLFVDEDNRLELKSGVNVMVRAQAFDESGQSWIHEVWVHISNWEKKKDIQTEDDGEVAKLTILYQMLQNYLKGFPLFNTFLTMLLHTDFLIQ